MNKKYQNLILLLVITLSLICFVSSADWTVSIERPANNGKIGGYSINNVSIFNVTIDSSTAGSQNNTLGCTLYLQSSLTANSTLIQFGPANQTNETSTMTGPGLVNFTYLVDDIYLDTFEDGNDYTLTVSCNNGSSAWTDTNTGITFDGSQPSAPTSITSGTQTDNTPTFTGTVVGKNTTSCDMIFVGPNPGSRVYSMTHSSDSCTYTFTSEVPDLSYQYIMMAGDGTNFTNTSLTSFRVDSGDIGINPPSQIGESNGIFDNTTFWMVIIVVLVIVIIIWRINK